MKVKDCERVYPFIKNYFHFEEFNLIQKQCIPHLLEENKSMVISAPTSGGKTVLLQLAILKCQQTEQKFKCVYLAPSKSLCQQKLYDWKIKFPKMRILELTGDTSESDSEVIRSANIIIATAEKLDYLTRNCYLNVQINLLLVDQIHMINAEGRGGVLEAVITRFLLKWSQLRVIGISATISNIQDVANWLNVEKSNIKQFGQNYRPVVIKKIVLGYSRCKNEYIFERILNKSLDMIIRKYSDQKPALIFCQTQKGTLAACEYLISALPKNYIITSQDQQDALIKCSKQITQKTLAHIITSGIAFHNASLNVDDRKIIVQQFIQQNIKIICTTSTLAQGMNLPARLAVIKGTLSYRGSGKGYTEYTGIQLEQMMGRAGRLGFDSEGTAVIMTENDNVRKYRGEVIQKQPLQSNLFQQIKEHINVQISLNNIRSIEDAITYIKKTFYYVRIKKQPRKYGINSQKQCQSHIINICEQTIKQLAQYELITINGNKIIPLELCFELSKSSISFSTTRNLLIDLPNIKSFQKFLFSLCGATQFQKFRSKLDERKSLKQLNAKNRYRIKDTIGTPAKKAFVLIQALLSKYPISEWELNRQSSEMLTTIKSIVYIFKGVLKSKNNFLLSYYCVSLLRYINKECWNFPQQNIMNDLHPMRDKTEIMRIHNIRNISGLVSTLESRSLSTLCHQPDTFNDYVLDYIRNYSKLVINSHTNTNTSIKEITISYPDLKFNHEMKHFTAIVGSDQQLYIITQSKSSQKSIKIYLKNYKLPMKIVFVFDRTIGFDQVFTMDAEDHWRQTGGLEYDIKEVQKDLKSYVSLQSSQNNRNITEKKKRVSRKLKLGNQKSQQQIYSQNQNQLSRESFSQKKQKSPLNTNRNEKSRTFYETSYKKNNRRRKSNNNHNNSYKNHNYSFQQINLHPVLNNQQSQEDIFCSPPQKIKPCIVQNEDYQDQSFSEYQYKNSSNKKDYYRKFANRNNKIDLLKQMDLSFKQNNSTNSLEKQDNTQESIFQKFIKLTTEDFQKWKGTCSSQSLDIEDLYNNL